MKTELHESPSTKGKWRSHKLPRGIAEGSTDAKFPAATPSRISAETFPAALNGAMPLRPSSVEMLTHLRQRESGRNPRRLDAPGVSPTFDRAYRQLLRESEMAVWNAWSRRPRNLSHSDSHSASHESLDRFTREDRPLSGSWVLWILAAIIGASLFFGTDGNPEFHARWLQFISRMREWTA